MSHRVTPEARIEGLCRAWQQARNLEKTNHYDYDFNNFYGWVIEHHPDALNFRTEHASVKFVVEEWFDRFFGMG